MAYEFKNLNEVPVQGAPTENTTVMAFESGNPRQIPASEFGGKGLVVDLRYYTISITRGDPVVIEDVNYDPIYEAITAGQNVVLQLHDEDFGDTFMTITRACVELGTGLVVYTSWVEILFMNGSYHTTA